MLSIIIRFSFFRNFSAFLLLVSFSFFNVIFFFSKKKKTEAKIIKITANIKRIQDV